MGDVEPEDALPSQKSLFLVIEWLQLRALITLEALCSHRNLPAAPWLLNELKLLITWPLVSAPAVSIELSVLGKTLQSALPFEL